MADNKIFAGPKIRRFRLGQGLTQSAMADALEISGSYLNLIERNQRPLTVQLLLKLAATYQINLEELQGEQDQALQQQLRDVFSDPLLAGEVPERSELLDMVDSAPNAAIAIIKLHRAYRESLDRLSGLSQMMARDGDADVIGGARLPADEVREKFESNSPYHPAIERAAEQLLSEIDGGRDINESMQNWLLHHHSVSVQVLPADVMPVWRRRFDRHSRRLQISERLSPADRMQEIAMEIAMLAHRKLIDEEVGFLKLATDEAERLARFEFARLMALAILMPYDRVLRAAKQLRYDINVLRNRFNVTFAQMAWRLTMLGKQGQSGVKFFVMEVDAAGNHVRRGGSQGFPVTRFGGNCPKLVVHQAFSNPGQVFAESVITPQNDVYLVVGRTVEGLRSGFLDRPQRTAMLVGYGIENKTDVIYSAEHRADELLAPVEIGPACRLCERQGCIARAHPPITRPLGLDDMVQGLSVFDFQ